MNLRDAARGRTCQIRAPGCIGGTETIVLAHLRMIGISAAGLKSPDLLASWACHACHDVVDGRRGGLDANERRLLLLDGMARTQYTLISEGAVTW